MNKNITLLFLLVVTLLLAISVVSAADSNSTTDTSTSTSIDDNNVSISETSSNSNTNEVKSTSDTSYSTQEVKTINNEVKSSETKNISKSHTLNTKNSDSNSQNTNNTSLNTQTNQTTKNSNSSYTSINNKEVASNENIIQTTSYNITNQKNNVDSANIVNNKSLSSSSITKNVNNYNELYNALEEAKTSSATDYTINLGIGNYNCTSVIKWGDSVTTKNLTINGNGQIINGSDSYSFIYVDYGYSLNLNNIVFTDFMYNSNFNYETFCTGGTINIAGGTLSINNSTFKNNYGSNGGAICTYESDIIISNSFFTNNSARFDGGAIYILDSNITIFNTSFVNHTETGSGSCISALYSKINIFNSSFMNNFAKTYGGALCLINSELYSNIINTTFINNTADIGGAIYNENYILTMKNSTFTNNTSDDGGAIYNCGNRDLKIYDSVLSSNYAMNGGAIFNYKNAVMTIDNSTFFDNDAWYDSNAIHNEGSLTLCRNTFTYNKSLYNSVYITNSNPSFYMYNNTITIPTISGIADYSVIIYSPISDYTISNTEKIIFKIYNSSGQCENVNAEKINYLAAINYTFNYKDLYTIFIDYNYFENYENNNIYLYSELYQIKTKITINSISNITIGNTVTITGKLQEINDLNIANTEIEIAVNNYNYKTITTNIVGDFEYDYITTEAGINNISINFKGNDDYISTSCFSTFNVTKIITKITLDQIGTQVVRNNFTVSGTLKDSEGNAISNATVTIFLNNWGETIKTNRNGEFSYKELSSIIGTNNLTVEFHENEYYSPSNASTSFDVIKMNSSITINPIENTTVGDRIIISGKLNNTYNISYNEIIVDINGNTSTLLTAYDGSFNIIYDTTTTGVNNITITFKGNDHSNPSTTTITFNVTKKNSELNVSTIDEIYVNNPLTITGQLISDDGKYLNHVNVTITINQDQLVAETRANGTYSLKYTPTIIGTNNVTISFDGNSNYTASTILASFEVLKEASNIKIDQVTTKNGYNVTFKATITDEDGNPINSGQATFKLNGVTLKVNGSQVKVNVTDGLAQYTYTVPNYSAKEYKLTVVYGLTDVRLEDSTTLVILKSDPELVLDSITSDGTTGHITGMLLDEHGVGVDRETKVSVKINGKTILSTRIYEGVINLSFDTSAYKSGVHNLTVIFGENGCYNTVTFEGAIAQNVKDTIVVNPVTGKNGDVVSFRAYIIDESGNSVTSGSATFKLNGVTVKENGTQIKVNFVNGVAEYNFTIPEYSAKDYNLTAVASVGGTRYEAKSVLTIQKSDTHLDLSDMTISQGSNAILRGQILDEHDNLVTLDTKVAVKINSKTVVNTRVYDGLLNISLDTQDYSSGTYNVTVIAGENGRYNTSTDSTTLSIVS